MNNLNKMNKNEKNEKRKTRGQEERDKTLGRRSGGGGRQAQTSNNKGD